MRVVPRVASGSRSDSAPAGAHVNDAAGPAINARLVGSVDFERVLRARPCALSAHFALHHVRAQPRIVRWTPRATDGNELSTARRTEMVRSVDDSVSMVDLPDSAVTGSWLGCVVPKRHARRAVTRTLLKRQIRSAAAEAELAPGLWVIRLRAGFDRVAFPSAASNALQTAARGELDSLLAKAPRPVAGRS